MTGTSVSANVEATSLAYPMVLLALPTAAAAAARHRASYRSRRKCGLLRRLAVATPTEDAAPASIVGDPISAPPPAPPAPGRWVRIEGVPVLRPAAWVPERGVVHFIGGAFAGAAPHWTYRRLLNALAARGLWVIATPLATAFDHRRLAADAASAFERTYAVLLNSGVLSDSLPVHGIGHSMGALLQALAGAGAADTVAKAYCQRLRGQVLISFNAQSLSGAVPLWRELWTREELRPAIGRLAEQLEAAEDQQRLSSFAEISLDLANLLTRAVGLEGAASTLGGSDRVADLYAPLLGQLPPLLRDVSNGVEDFAPNATELEEQLVAGYRPDLPVLLVRFKSDPIDQTKELERILRTPAPDMDEMDGSPAASKKERKVEVLELGGTHISPNFNEPLDPLDGTDALERSALDAETPLDAALLRAGVELTVLADAVTQAVGAGSTVDDGIVSSSEATSLAMEEPSVAQDSLQRLILEGLLANEVRHPLDRRQTRALELVPGLGASVRQLVRPLEQAIYQENLSSSVQVNEEQYPELHKTLLRACSILNIPEVPEMYVRQNPVPNAYTLAIQGKRPFVVVHTALLDLMTDAETEAVIAHELGHLKCEHGTWLAAANVMLAGVSALPLNPRLLGPLLERLQEDLGTWQRAAELSCDRAALLVAQDPWVPLSVIAKLSGGASAKTGASALPRERLEAFLTQAEQFDKARTEASPVEAMLAAALRGGRPRTHPIPVLRARELKRWADSGQFQQLLDERGQALEVVAA